MNEKNLTPSRDQILEALSRPLPAITANNTRHPADGTRCSDGLRRREGAKGKSGRAEIYEFLSIGDVMLEAHEVFGALGWTAEVTDRHVEVEGEEVESVRNGQKIREQRYTAYAEFTVRVSIHGAEGPGRPFAIFDGVGTHLTEGFRSRLRAQAEAVKAAHSDAIKRALKPRGSRLGLGLAFDSDEREELGMREELPPVPVDQAALAVVAGKVEQIADPERRAKAKAALEVVTTQDELVGVRVRVDSLLTIEAANAAARKSSEAKQAAEAVAAVAQAVATAQAKKAVQAIVGTTVNQAAQAQTVAVATVNQAAQAQAVASPPQPVATQPPPSVGAASPPPESPPLEEPEEDVVQFILRGALPEGVTKALAIGATPGAPTLVPVMPTDPTADDLLSAGWPENVLPTAADLSAIGESQPISLALQKDLTGVAVRLVGRDDAGKTYFAVGGAKKDPKSVDTPILTGYQARLFALLIGVQATLKRQPVGAVT